MMSHEGRADAPPGITCNIGVSTSIKPLEMKYSRIPATTLERIIKVRRDSSLESKSK